MSSSQHTLVAVFAALYLTACGQKGPLYLPTPEEEARMQAAEQQAEQAKEKEKK